MIIDDSEELEKPRRQLQEVTAERDKLLAENRRLRDDSSMSLQGTGNMNLPPVRVSSGPSPVSGKLAADPAATPWQSRVARGSFTPRLSRNRT